MSPNLDSPVRMQMAVALLNNLPAGGDFISNKIIDAKPVGRRRVFVQTETGCVLGLELDRQDNAHTVKRKLQIALNVPTEESSLTFGDLVLKNDLTAVRGDSPLLLTRNSMHRSSSTPCLSPSTKELQQRDSSGLIEILGCSSRCGRMKQLVKVAVKAIKSGIDPIPVQNGLGGAYYFRNKKGDKVAIVKPTDEEPFAPNNPKGFVGKALGQPGLKRSVRVGETGFREVAAYLLDHGNFANVPPTALVKITHSVFHLNDGMHNGSARKQQVMSKIASFQQYIVHDFDASDHGTSSFSVAAIHRIGILDIRILNTDRHSGNLLIRKVEDGVGGFGARMELIPIDHGLCLPENLEDPYFEWIHWPQASVPFSEEELEYIANLDPVEDSDMLRRELPMIREACLRVLILCTVFLKRAAAFGLCLAEIGEMMSREFSGREEEPSELEIICMEARKLVTEREVFSPEGELEEEEDFQFHMECDEDGRQTMYENALQSFNFQLNGGYSRNALSRLEEGIEEEEEENEEESSSTAESNSSSSSTQVRRKNSFDTKLSASLKAIILTEKTPRVGTCNKSTSNNPATKANGWDHGGVQGGNSRSADEKLPSSTSFVKLADMVEEVWMAFLENFQDLLDKAFRNRKCSAAGQRQKQRLGTSCQF